LPNEESESFKNLQEQFLFMATRDGPKQSLTICGPGLSGEANDVLIETPLMQNKEKLSPHQLFSNTRTQPDPKHWKPFGCPVHVLDSTIQGGRGTIHKWKQ
jgi:hypothetical protein